MPRKDTRPIGEDGKRIRKIREPMKLDKAKVLELRVVKGLSVVDIAEHQNVAVSTITRFLAKHRELGDLEEFKNNRADWLTAKQMKNHIITDRLTDHLLADGAIDALSESEKSTWLYRLEGASTYANNTERLERGQSTSNVDMQQTLAWIRSVPLPDPE